MTEIKLTTKQLYSLFNEAEDKDSFLQSLSLEQLQELEKYQTIKSIQKNDNWNPPKSKLRTEADRISSGFQGSASKYYLNYMNRNKDFETRSGYTHNKEELDKVRFQVFENQQWKECGFDGLWGNTSSDSGCEDDVSDWSPADSYAKAIWSTAVCKADLFKIAVKGLAVNPGDGLGIQIRTFGAFGDPTSLAACECASCASITFSTYTLTLKQYDLEAIVCNLDAFDVGDALMDSYIKSMGDSYARWFDKQIYSELETATPGTTESIVTLSCSPSLSGSCCTDSDLLNLYNAINKTIASMREGTGLSGPVSPDYLIVSPSVAKIFKAMQTPSNPFALRDVVYDEDGRLKKVSGLKVIEYCSANSCTDAAGEVVAIIIDSSQAVGAVFGMKPKLYKFLQTNCNSVRLDMWSYFGTSELNTDCIAHICNG